VPHRFSSSFPHLRPLNARRVYGCRNVARTSRYFSRGFAVGRRLEERYRPPSHFLLHFPIYLYTWKARCEAPCKANLAFPTIFLAGSIATNSLLTSTRNNANLISYCTNLSELSLEAERLHISASRTQIRVGMHSSLLSQSFLGIQLRFVSWLLVEYRKIRTASISSSY
jgi:hypothetical protein